MIRITRNFAIGGLLALAVSATSLGLGALPALADYQAGVDAYYKGDFRAAYDSWLPLAEAGDAVAQNSLGALYDHGLGVIEDNAEAARWYEAAANQGMPLAMRNLANQYASGHGVPFDLEMARQWYEKAAALGDQQSAALLAHLRPATAPVDTTASVPTTTFSAPTTTGNLAEPVEGTAAPVSAESSADTVIADIPTNQPTAPATAPTGPILLDAGGTTATLGADGQTSPAQPAVTAQPASVQPASVQEAAVTPIAPVAPRTDGNWIIGQWQGPSLGCPKGGGIEFTDGETMSWFDGQVAVRLAANYQINGDNIVVNAIAADGTSQQYTYQRSGPDKMIIVNVPPSMPKSLLGIAYRRCGAAPSATQSASIPAQPAAPAATSTVPIIGGGTGAAPALPANTQPATPVQPSTPVQPVAATPATAAPATPGAAPGAAPQYTLNEQAAFGKSATSSDTKAAEGWAAFEQGNYQEALNIFKTLADAGNTNMQVLVGNMYDYGQGVPQDDVQALQWYLMAASKGNTKGQYQAANLYFTSPTVPKDLIESYRWASLAAKGPKGEPVTIWAQQLQSVLTANMSDDDIDDAKALAKKSVKTQ